MSAGGAKFVVPTTLDVSYGAALGIQTRSSHLQLRGEVLHDSHRAAVSLSDLQLPNIRGEVQPNSCPVAESSSDSNSPLFHGESLANSTTAPTNQVDGMIPQDVLNGRSAITGSAKLGVSMHGASSEHFRSTFFSGGYGAPSEGIKLNPLTVHGSPMEGRTAQGSLVPVQHGAISIILSQVSLHLTETILSLLMTLVGLCTVLPPHNRWLQTASELPLSTLRLPRTHLVDYAPHRSRKATSMRQQQAVFPRSPRSQWWTLSHFFWSPAPLCFCPLSPVLLLLVPHINVHRPLKQSSP